VVAIVRKNVPLVDGNAEPPRTIAADAPGLSSPGELSVTNRLGPAGDRPISTAWVSDRLLAHTIDIWSRAYDRPVTTQEAMEILMNVKRFGELLIRAREKSET